MTAQKIFNILRSMGSICQKWAFNYVMHFLNRLFRYFLSMYENMKFHYNILIVVVFHNLYVVHDFSFLFLYVMG